MHRLANTKSLVEEGVITQTAARLIESRSRSTMVTLAINAVLCLGILFATGGLIFWLADAVLVAVFGLLLLGGGVVILSSGHDLYAMFGKAAALIGAGMLIGGAGVELADKHEHIAGTVMALGGAAIATVAAWALTARRLAPRFVTGAVMLMAGTLHLVGVEVLISDARITGLPVHLFWLYAAGAVALAGWIVDLRVVSALAIGPFAQALDTSTAYFHAAYVFYSPEATLSVLQMTLLVLLGLAVARRCDERTARHARIHVIMAFIVANLCALVGSLWGDVVGEHVWGPGARPAEGVSYDIWRDQVATFRASALVIHEHVFSVLWAVVLAGTIFYAAHRNLRGLFNAAVTFAGLHAYTQVFETFYDEPLAYVVGGFAAIPLAWGMWRLNTWFMLRHPAQS
ncbi:hypothetical protein [Roseobacter weihaiensis]|uniref:hypothetical protein n=1 Tax=Roseobacter weihaiensis TaxID=2763262 RepID=UPI001D0B0D49|nr:hypothetical protein [Roseobacter sp. H9]